MVEDHPNLALLARLDLRDLQSCVDLFAPDFVWHYFNPNLPELEGSYQGLDGVKRFFGTLAASSKGSFHVEPQSAHAAGDELVVVHVKNTMIFEDKQIEVDGISYENKPISIDAVVVWRVINGQFTEAWDIPSAYTMAGTD